jgi:hypothetical protein
LESAYNIKAPTIIIPENCVDPNCNLLILDLGTLVIESVQKTKKTKDKDFYDEFRLNMTELKALMSPSSEKWRSVEVRVRVFAVTRADSANKENAFSGEVQYQCEHKIM